MARSWSFPPFRLDLGTGSLWRDDALVPLPPKPFAVLATLVAHAGQVVTKEALFEAAWPDTAVTDGVLKGCIRQIRHALGERAGTAIAFARPSRRSAGRRQTPGQTAHPPPSTSTWPSAPPSSRSGVLLPFSLICVPRKPSQSRSVIWTARGGLRPIGRGT
jgi:Transcriptional regulatory protein, C terminal